MKLCQVCRISKPTVEFYKRKASQDGLARLCKKCQKDYDTKRGSKGAYRRKKARVTKQWRKKHPHRTKLNDIRKHYQRHYGLTLDDYDRMQLAQNGVCAICKKPDPNKRLSVDHNHMTKQIRGLLCHNCNVALGLLKDNPYVLDNAATYLRSFSPPE